MVTGGILLSLVRDQTKAGVAGGPDVWLRKATERTSLALKFRINNHNYTQAINIESNSYYYRLFLTFHVRLNINCWP